MTPVLLIRLMFRESRGARARFAFFASCLAVGVAAIVSVAGLSAAIERTIRKEARKLLAADLAVESYQPLPAEIEGILARSEGIELTRISELVTMAVAPAEAGEAGRSQLVELKVVDGEYPFYGELDTDPSIGLPDLLADHGLVTAPDLLTRLGLKPGDRLLLGGFEFRVSGLVRSEPDRISSAFSLGPRVLVAAESFARTGLEARGSRILRRLLVKLPDEQSAESLRALAAELRALVGPTSGIRIETHVDAQPNLRRGVRRVERFLGLVALLSLLLGGVGVAQTTRAWLSGRTDAIAILRCLGLRPRDVLLLYLAQSFVLGLAGSVVGVVLGLSVLTLFPAFLGELLPVASLPAWQPAAVARGLTLGVGVALLFCFAPLLATRRVTPLRVLRKDVEPLPRQWWAPLLTGGVLVVGVWLTATMQADSIRLGSWFAAGSLFAAAFLAGAGRLLMSSLAPAGRRLPRLWMRWGLASLSRPGAATIGAVMALGMGTLLILGLALVESSLEDELRSELPKEAPTAFLIDIQPHQWPEIRRLLEREGAEQIDSVPIVTARLRQVDGRPVEELAALADRDGGRRWALTREQRLTYLEKLPADNRIVEGTLWSDPAIPEISVEQDFADDLGLELGSTLVFDLQGVPVELTATSLRTVDWGTFGINFFLVVEPGVLEEAPQQRVAAARLPREREQAIQDLLATRFPNVTLLRIREVLEKVATVLERLAQGVRFLGAFTVLAGIVILGGAVSANTVRRGREIALLKTLGMTGRGVAAMLATEYVCLGTVAGLIGAVGAALLSWAVLTYGMELAWRPRPGALLVALLAAILLTAATGILASWPALRRRPVEVLRSE